LDYQTLRLTLERGIARLTLLRPELDLRCLRELDDAVSALSETDGLRVLILDSAGPDFAQGWSADAVAALSRPPETLDPANEPFGRLAALPVPVVAALKGAVRSGGLELALACDIRLAAEGARFAMPETELGLIPLAGGGQRLARIAGRGAALAMLLAGEELDAAAALRCGLVSRVLAAGELEAGTQRLATTIASRGPLGVRLAKEAIHRGLDMTLAQGLRYELDLSILLQTTADRAEGVRAFLEKRPPNFESR